MKVLIMEAYTDANIGSGALIENAIKIVKAKYPQCDIQIQAHNRDAVHEFTGFPTSFEMFCLPYRQSRAKQVVWLLANTIWMFVHFFVRILRLPIPLYFYTYDGERRASLEAIKGSDLCVSIGAERINDNFYLGLPYSLYALWVVKDYQKKLVMFPQTIGPFHFSVSRFFSRRILTMCDHVYARDGRSLDALRSLGLSSEKFAFVPDIAILQAKCTENEIEAIFLRERIPNNCLLAGISVMEWSYFKAPSGSSNYQDYKRIVAEAVDFLIERYRYHVVFVPTNLRMRGCRDDDVKSGDEIFELIRNKSQVTLIRNLYTPSQTKGLLSRMDIFIATRMHACILATSAFIPTLSINYQFKLYEYMKLLDLEDNTIDIEKLSFEILKSLIDRTYADREKIRSQLGRKIAELVTMIDEKLIV